MKSPKFYLIALLLTLTVVGCYYDKEELLYGSSCTASLSQPAGPNFTNVKTIINSKCAGCHTNGGQSGGYNYDTDCKIVDGWNGIYQSCVVNGNMPQGGSLTSAEKSQITAWKDAGHRYTD